MSSENKDPQITQLALPIEGASEAEVREVETAEHFAARVVIAGEARSDPEAERREKAEERRERQGGDVAADSGSWDRNLPLPTPLSAKSADKRTKPSNPSRPLELPGRARATGRSNTPQSNQFDIVAERIGETDAEKEVRIEKANSGLDEARAAFAKSDKTQQA